MRYLAFSSIPVADMLKTLKFMADISHRSSIGKFTYEDLASALDKWFDVEQIPMKTHTFLAVLFDSMDKPNSVATKISPENLVSILKILPERLKNNIPDEFIEKSIPQKFWPNLRPLNWISSHT